MVLNCSTTKSYYYVKRILPKREVIFDTELIKIKVDIENAEHLFKKAIELLNSECPQTL